MTRPNEKAKKWFLCIGDLVNYHAKIGGPVTSTDHVIRSIIKDSAGQEVAVISGKRGIVSLDALSPRLNGQKSLF
jgi:hypothetical protein